MPLHSPVLDVHRSLLIVGIGLTIGMLAGCGSAPSRATLDDASLAAQRRSFVDENNAAYAADLDKLLARMELKVERAADPADVIYDVLLVHGGGPSGAFTTGFLLGWGEVDDAQMARPEFDMVTGSSAGALVAPFIFVGTKKAYNSLRELTLNPPFEFRAPSIWSMWPRRSGMTDIRSFREGLGEIFDPEFLADVLSASNEHKSLMISGTNVDLGLGRFWDVGRQLGRLEGNAARERMRDMVMASAAMPVAFPPVEIDDNLYVDGGVTANIYIGFDGAGLRRIAEKWYERHPGIAMPIVRVWVLLSRELFLRPVRVQPRYLDIGRRSLTIMMEYDRFKSLVAIMYMLEELEEHPGIRTELRYAMPPPDADFPVEVSSIHDKEVVKRMLDMGYSLGADVDSWSQEMPDTFMLRQQ